MSLGPLMVDIAGTALSSADRDVLADPLVGGVILFTRNYESRAQLAALTAEIHSLRAPPLLIAVDHEGGRVQRFRPAFTALPALASIGARYDHEPHHALHLATETGWLMAAELRALGVDFSFAPVLDLYTDSSRVIRERAFHAEPAAVARLAQAFLRGMHGAGMAGVGKHFPGHGSVDADSHHEMPVDPRQLSTIRHRDMQPFRLLVQAGIDALMPAHIVFPAVDALPVGYSRIWLQEILRGELGFQGMVFSDDLSMSGAAIADSPVERAELALAAGCDICLLCNDRRAVERVLGGLSVKPQPLSVVRMMRMHGRAALDDAALQQSERRHAVQAALAALAATA